MASRGGRRRTLYARLSPEAYQAYVDFADEIGVNVNDIIEAGGLRVEMLKGHREPYGEFIELARRIHRERLSRRRGEK